MTASRDELITKVLTADPFAPAEWVPLIMDAVKAEIRAELNAARFSIRLEDDYDQAAALLAVGGLLNWLSARSSLDT